MKRIELDQDNIDPIAATQRLHLLNEARINLRTATIAKTGMLPQTPILDGAIQWLEDAIAYKLPRKPLH